MPIPPTTLLRIQDLLRIPESVTTYDVLITNSYEIELKSLLLQSDFLVESQPFAAVADKAIYPLSTRTVRVLAMFHGSLALARVPSRTNDLLREWETEASGSPEEFTLDHLPLSVDSLAAPLPEQVLIRPAPAVSTIVDIDDTKWFFAWAVMLPDDQTAALLVPYLEPYLVYRTAARVLEQDTDIRDLPASQLWAQFAMLWRTAILQIIKM